MIHRMNRTLGFAALGIVFALAATLVIVPRVAAQTPCFPDVGGHWAETFICWLKSEGIVSGYGDGTYRPDNNVTRGEMAVYIQRVHNIRGLTPFTVYGEAPELRIDDTGANVSDSANLLFQHAGSNRFGLGIDPFSAQARDFTIYDYSSASYRLYMDDNGRTGIGTTSPDTFLHVKSGESGDPVMTVYPTTAIYGECEELSCAGVRGSSSVGFAGVVGTSASGAGGFFGSLTGTALVAAGLSGYALIQGEDTGNIRFIVERATGNVKADGAFTSPADFAELMTTSGAPSDYQPGDVMVISMDGRVARSAVPYDTAVAGVYSARPGFLGDTQISEVGLDAAEAMPDDDRIAVAILGIVPVKASAENGSIQPGDLLTTSTTPGHAMKCTEKLACFGAVIGKALEALDSGTGLIRVLVTLK